MIEPPPPAAFGTSSIEPPTHGFSDHFGLLDKHKKSMENGVVKCPIVTTPDLIEGIDRQFRFIREHLMVINNHLDEIKQTRPPEYLSIKSTASRFDLTEQAVRSMVGRREVSFYKLGSRVRLDAKEFEKRLIKYPGVDDISLLG